ncbi:MAG: hypothetical protein R3E79_07410 [Caldilineaceae bacterium]
MNFIKRTTGQKPIVIGILLLLITLIDKPPKSRTCNLVYIMAQMCDFYWVVYKLASDRYSILRRITIPFNIVDGQMRGSLFWVKEGKYPLPLMPRIVLTKDQ